MSFPLDSYARARDAFLADVASIADEHLAFPLPAHHGPVGEALTIDVARFGPAQTARVLLCVSGTHGAEGYPGSLAQRAWVDARRTEIANGRPDDLAVWLVHAANHYGFAWGLRNNEDNIDLNRNWIDFNRPLPETPDFDRLRHLVTPESVSDAVMARHLAALLELVEEQGEAWVESVMTEGQYRFPDAPAWGGDRPSFSRAVLTDLIQSRMTGAERVAYVDFHSGTPDPTALLFLCFSEPGSAAFRRAATWWGEDALSPETVEAGWGGKRPARNGLMFHGVERAFGPRVDVAGAVVEFGTVAAGDRLTLVQSILAENYWRFRGAADPDREQLRALIARPFHRYGDLAWEHMVRERGSAVLDAAYRGLVDWGPPEPMREAG
jgi:hypothetical protein